MEITYHGIKYVISANANNNHRQCRDLLVGQIFDKISISALNDEWTQDEYLGKKKELVAKLKDWDKKYIAHAKTVNPELALIHASAMAPLMAFLKSNKDFYNLNVMKEKQKNIELSAEEKLPDFRYDALEKEFVKDFTEICRIISLYPCKVLITDEGKFLEYPYDIKQMLDTLKVDNWRNIPPFRFYFEPLEKALNKTIEELLAMEKRGPLQIRYSIPNNEEMFNKIVDTMKEDLKV